jgi:glycosyltransferase involved in cell wall biosynthesis
VKVLLVHNTYQQPGGEDVVFEQEALMLKSAGHEVVTYRRSNMEVEAYQGLKLISLAKGSIWASDSRRDFVELLREEKPDVVHVHNTFMMISPSIYSACTEERVPVVQTLHNYRLMCPAATLFRKGKVCEECVGGSLWPSIKYGCYHDQRSTTAVVATMLTTHRMLGTWTKDITYYVALTEFSRGRFIEGGMPSEKILVKPNFVNPDPFARTGPGEYALFVGRLSPEKRVSTVLAAWKQLPASISIKVIGGGPDRPALEAQAVHDGLTHVQFAGQMPRAQTLAAINNAKFLVFSSEWYENFPVTIAEAFACRTPVIASRMGAMQEIVEDGRTGLLFNTGDPADLAAKVRWAWSHPDEMQKMGEAARQEYETKYTAEKNLPILMEIYQRAIAAKK